MSLELTRHSDIIKNVNLDMPINVFGAGSIGSYTVLALTKLGFRNITVYDNGKVDSENISPQFYTLEQMGMNKVDALRTNILNATGIRIRTFHGDLYDILTNRINIRNSTSHKALYGLQEKDGSRISSNNGIHGEAIQILAVDSMDLREVLYLDFHSVSIGVIDARMAVKFLTVYCSRGTDKLGKTLYKDEDSVQEACTNKATSFTSLMAGSMVSRYVLALCDSDDELIGKDYTVSRVTHFDINTFDLINLNF